MNLNCMAKKAKIIRPKVSTEDRMYVGFCECGQTFHVDQEDTHEKMNGILEWKFRKHPCFKAHFEQMDEKRREQQQADNNPSN